MIPTSLFSKYQDLKPIRSRRSERSDLVSYFLEKINASRVGTVYKPLTIEYMAVLLSAYSVSQLYQLRIKCDNAKTFAKCFWYFAKAKSIDNTAK